MDLDCNHTDPAPVDRLMRLIGIERDDPSGDYLSRIVTAFMLRVPFENVSKLYYFRRDGLRFIPDFRTYLDGIEHYRFGGTCYSNNHYLNLLLTELRFDARLCGADMNNPDVHLVNMVTVDGREYLVDVGYAAPFMMPLPRDLDRDHVVELGQDRYVLKPQDEQGRSRLIMYRDGVERHGYVAKPEAREISYFAGVIEDSFRPEATFLNSLLAVRWYPDRAVRINNLDLTEMSGTSFRTQKLKSRNDLAVAVEVHLNIPREIVAEAIADLTNWGDAWN